MFCKKKMSWCGLPLSSWPRRGCYRRWNKLFTVQLFSLFVIGRNRKEQPTPRLNWFWLFKYCFDCTRTELRFTNGRQFLCQGVKIKRMSPCRAVGHSWHGHGPAFITGCVGPFTLSMPEQHQPLCKGFKAVHYNVSCIKDVFFSLPIV